MEQISRMLKKSQQAPSSSTPRSSFVQRQCACGGVAGIDDLCEQCRSQQLSEQRGMGNSLELSRPAPLGYDDLHTHIRSSQGGGQPLPETTRAFMESRFGYDFSQVRIHNDGEADQLTHTVNALAFTSGQDIFFQEGKYDPTSSDGQRLLAHEIVHTVQQASGPVSGNPISDSVSVSSPSDSFEMEADRVTDRLIRSPVSEQSNSGLSYREAHSHSHDITEEPRTSPVHPGSSIAPQTAEHVSLNSGHESLQLSPDPAPQKGKQSTLRQRTRNLELGSTRSNNKMNELLLLQSFQADVLAKVRDWQAAALTVGSAYARAVSTHQRILGKRAQAQALENAVCAMILTAATAGALSWLGQAIAAEAASAATAEKLVVIPRPMLFALDGTLLESAASKAPQVPPLLSKATAEAAALAATSEGIDIGQQVKQPEAQPAGEEPLVYQNRRLIAITLTEKEIMGKFSKKFKDLAALPPSAFDKFDPKASEDKYNKWLSLADKFPGMDQLPGGKPDEKERTIERELERGIWARWIPLHLVETYTDPYMLAKVGIRQEKTIYHSPGSDLERRFDELGITKASGVGDFGWWTSDAEIRLVVAWARGYTPNLTKPHSY